MSEGTGTTRDSAVQSVDRAVSILQVLARRGATGVTGIAEELGLHKSTVSRLLGTLEARGLVERTAGRGAYRLGHGVLLLAQGVNTQPDLVQLGRPVLVELAEELGETVNIDVREGNRAVTVDQVTGRSSLSAVNWVGRHDRLHVTAPGRIFLAEMGDTELAGVLAEGLEAFTEHTTTDEARLHEELARVRDLGYAVTTQELEIGLVAVAVPIRSFEGAVVAGLSASGPVFRMAPEAVPGLARRLDVAAARISERLGHLKAG